MRITLLVTDLQPGGTPLRFACLARELRDLGHDISVGCLASPGPVSADLDRDNIDTFACDARGPRDLRTFARLAGHLRRIHSDVMFSCLTHANVAARLVGRWLDIPVLTSTATIEVERRWHRRWERWTARLDRGHVVNSRTLAEHVHTAFGIPREKIHRIPPFVRHVPAHIDRHAARRQLGLPADAFIVLWAGRLDPVKRIDLLIDAVTRMDDDNLVLALAGDGPLPSQLQRMESLHGSPSRVHILGWQHDLSAAFSAADLFAFPSLTEGMPSAVLQALAFGLPVIASDIPAHREIDDNQNRLLIVPEATPAAYADAIEQLRNDPDQRNTLSERGQAWTAELTPRNAAEALLAAIHRALHP